MLINIQNLRIEQRMPRFRRHRKQHSLYSCCLLVPFVRLHFVKTFFDCKLASPFRFQRLLLWLTDDGVLLVNIMSICLHLILINSCAFAVSLQQDD